MENKIYLLRDPRSGEIQYVGKTSLSFRLRIKGHLYQPRGHMKPWIDDLRTLNLRPRIELIEQCGDDWPTREQYWISHYRNLGHDLANTARGGAGCLGFKHTAESIEKIRQAHRGRRFSPEHRKKISLGRKGISPRMTPEQVAKNIARLKSPEFQIRMRETLKGNKHTLGRHLTAEHKAKLRSWATRANPFQGQRHTTESRLLISHAAKAREARRRLEKNGDGHGIL